MPDETPVYTTTWAELLDRCCGPQQPGESNVEYHQRAQHALGKRSEPLPPPPPSKHLDGQTDDYYDSGAEDIWCVSCNEERLGERGLSCVRRDEKGQPIERVWLRDCKRCHNAFLRSE